ncbi:MAG: T9SS type A sorting domain-containing protein, partial [Bacteroidales bacterium]
FAFNDEVVETGSHPEFCFNEDVEVTLEEIVSGQGPVAFSYVLNDDEPVLVDEVAEGDVLFGPDVLPVGDHTLHLTMLEDANGCQAENVEDIYTMDITVNPEPAVLFSFNDEIAETGSELYFLADETVTVELADIVAGDAPIEFTYVLNDDDPVTVEDVAEGDVLYDDVLPEGFHTLEITSLIDANGCEVVDPETIYNLTIEVEDPVVEVETIAELRDMPEDGTIYKYTGEAVIVAMDGFRNRKFLEDETAAIMIDDQPGTIETEYDLYDVITDVVGQLNTFNQMLQFQPTEDAPDAVDNTPVDPTVFALDEVTSDDQAKLIRFEEVYFIDLDEGEVFENGTNYTLSDGENEFTLRTDFWNVDYIGEEIPTIDMNINGVILQYEDNLQIVPRFGDDLEEIFVAELPFEEDFTGVSEDEMPDYWVATSGNWSVQDSNDAGGESAPELEFNWLPSGDGTFRAITPLIDGTGVDNIVLEFMHSLDDYSGDYTLKIQTSLDGETWTDQWELYVEENKDATDRESSLLGDIDPEMVSVLLEDVAGEEFHVAFVFEGNTYNVNQWYIDDVVVDEMIYIAELPFEEDFTDVPVDELPDFWDRTHENWSVQDSNEAGGESAPELEFYWSPADVTEFRAVTPLIDAEGVDDLMLTFMHMVDDYSGNYSLKVQTSLDGETWTDQWTMDIAETVRDDEDRSVGGRNVPSTEEMVMLEGVGQEEFHIAFVFDGDSWDINNWYIDDILVDEAPDMFEVSFNVKEDSDDETPIEGASIQVDGEEIITDVDGMASIDLVDGNYTATIAATGYESEEVTFDVAGDDLSIEVHMMDVIVEPYNLSVDTDEGEDADALFIWNDDGDIYEFRYDDGVVDGQLGFQNADYNSVMGTVHHNDAILHEMSWYLTDEGGPHATVKVWVLGLDEDGYPDRDNVLYSAEDVPNTHEEWNTYEFTDPVEASEGFFIGLSADGFLGLAVDDGEGEPWDFVPGTQFGIADITDGDLSFTDIQDWDFEVNYLLRAHGNNLGEIEKGSHVASNDPTGPAPELILLTSPVEAGEPFSKFDDKAFEGFDVYLNDDYVDTTTETEYMFTDLPAGEHTAGVRSVYSTGMSDIITVDFYIEDYAPDTYEVQFLVDLTYAIEFNLLENFDTDVHQIMITGDMVDWAEPGDDPDNQIMDWHTEDPMVYAKTFQLEAGTYEYKYFSDLLGEGWDGGEWEGGDNRVVEVEDDMVVEDYFGYTDDEVATSNPDDVTLNIYPVPASDRLNIETDVRMSDIRMIDMLGQVVYNESVNGNHHEINVSNMQNGVYFIQMTTNAGVITQRVQVAK